MPHHRRLAPRFVRVDLDVVADARRGIQAEHRVRFQRLHGDDFFQHCAALGKNAARRLADHRVLQDLRIAAREVPGLEERRPVDVAGNFGEIVAGEEPAAEDPGPRRRVASPVDSMGVGPRPGHRHERLSFLGRVLGADLFIVLAHRLHIVPTQVGREQIGAHRYRPGRVGHIHGGAGVMRRDLDRGVHARSRRPADE